MRLRMISNYGVCNAEIRLVGEVRPRAVPWHCGLDSSVLLSGLSKSLFARPGYPSGVSVFPPIVCLPDCSFAVTYGLCLLVCSSG